MLKLLMQYWPLVNLVFGAFVVWVCWSLRQLANNEIASSTKRLQDKDDELALLIDGHDTRLTKVELEVDALQADIKELPTKADFARLEGEVKSVSREVTAVGSGVQRIEGFFLKKGVDA